MRTQITVTCSINYPLEKNRDRNPPYIIFMKKTCIEVKNPFKVRQFCLDNVFFGKVLILIACDRTISNICDSREKVFFFLIGFILRVLSNIFNLKENSHLFTKAFLQVQLSENFTFASFDFFYQEIHIKPYLGNTVPIRIL